MTHQPEPKWLKHLVRSLFKLLKTITLDEFDQAILSSSALYLRVSEHAGWLFIQTEATTIFIVAEPQYNQQVLKHILTLVTLGQIDDTSA